MTFFYLVPSWFFGYGIALEIIFGIVTALVALLSMKVYNLCEQRECKLMGLAFSSIAISYFILPLVNLFAITQIKSGIGYADDQKRTLKALGLKRMNQSVVQDDLPSIRGMIVKVRHLVKVEESI